MLVTHLNYSDINGGAARAAYRLFCGLNLLEIDSYMLVVEKKSNNKKVFSIKKNTSNLDYENRVKEKFLLDIVQNKYIDQNRTDLSNTLFTIPYPGYNLNAIPLIQNSDIINFHWMSYYLSTSSLKNLFLLNKPFIWTLHDQNPFTGGCHYTAGCNKYISEDCFDCPQINNDYFTIPNNFFLDKINLFKNVNLSIVTPSRWLASCAKKSKLFKNFRIETIPNSIETDIFYPIDKRVAKQKLAIREESITILFGAENGNEKRKGFFYLYEAIKHCFKNEHFQNLVKDKKINILCFGDPSSDLANLNIDIKSLGYVKQDQLLNIAYNASDFVVLPSIEDNLPNIILEAFACQTPVISFDIGGMPDIIINDITGKLAKSHDYIDLSNKIIDTIVNIDSAKLMGSNCRKFVEDRLTLTHQAKNYLELYKDIISNKDNNNKTHFDFYKIDNYDAYLNIDTEKNFANNNIFKSTYDMFKRFYSLSVSNQRIVTSKSYRIGITLLHPTKIFEKVGLVLERKLTKIFKKERDQTNLFKENRPHILFDHQIFNLQNYGGISRYFSETFNIFKKFDLVDMTIPIVYSNNHYLKNYKDLIKELKTYRTLKTDIENFLPKLNFKGKKKLFYILKKFGFIKGESYYKNKNKKIVTKKLKEQKFTLFHPTYYDDYFLKYISNKPFVITVHDMIHEIFSDKFPQLKDNTSIVKKRLALKASKIIAVSNNTKNDIIRLYGIDESKIKVIYHATSISVDKNIDPLTLNLPKRYILFIGDRSNYKNFYFFLHSITPLLREDKDLYLVLGGGKDLSSEEIFFLKGNYVEDKIIQKFVNDTTLGHLYANAICFVFPSLYEGFGIPILEAFTCGCPVVLSNTSCFPEIAEDSALFFDPYSENSIRLTVEKFVYDESLREEFIKKGYERVKKFSWQKTAVETAMVYESLNN